MKLKYTSKELIMQMKKVWQKSPDLSMGRIHWSFRFDCLFRHCPAAETVL